MLCDVVRQLYQRGTLPPAGRTRGRGWRSTGGCGRRGGGHGGQHLAPGQQGGVGSEIDIVLGNYETEFSTNFQSVNVKG